MANYEATRYNINAAKLTGIQGVNTGIIIPWSSASLPSGFLECNGAAVSTSTYADLYAVIGYTYGNPGGGNFNLPDLADKTVVNKSNSKALASTGGANNTSATGNLGGTVANTTLTTAQIPSHSHTITAYAGAGGGINPTQMFRPTSGTSTSGSAGGGGAHNHNIGGTFTGSSVSVLQPYIVLIYIIKT